MTHLLVRESLLLTLSYPVASNGYTSKCSGLSWSNPLLLILLIFWHSGTLALSPECPNIKKDLLDQYGDECFGKLIFATIRKRVGLEGLSSSLFLIVGDWFQTDQVSMEMTSWI